MVSIESIEAIATFLVIFSARMNISFIIEMENSCLLNGYIRFLNYVHYIETWLTCFEHVVQFLLLKDMSFWWPFLDPH